jgi:hypothetical protein
MAVGSLTHRPKAVTAQQKDSLMQSRVKLTLAGLVVLLAASFVVSAPVHAGPGHFFIKEKKVIRVT